MKHFGALAAQAIVVVLLAGCAATAPQVAGVPLTIPPKPPMNVSSIVERLPPVERLPTAKPNPSVVVERTVVIKPTVVFVRPSGEQTKTVAYLKNLRACFDGVVAVCNLATLSVEDYKRVKAAAAARAAIATNGADKSTCVDGYFRKNGTYVHGYCRAAKTN